MSEQGSSFSASRSRRGDMKLDDRDSRLVVVSALRLEGKLCDVVINVCDVEFTAHKIILCSCSSYFCTLFTSLWASPEKKLYTIPGVSPEMMRLIINYAYTSSVPVTEDNVMDVMGAADQFLVPGMMQACCSFLEEQLCLMNCIGIWRLVDFYHCPEFKSKVFLYILHHFEEIVSISQEFLDLSEHQLAAFLESDHLSVKRENVVFEVVLRWIDHLPDQRRGHLLVLLTKVRLGLLTTEYFRNSVMNNPMMNDNPESLSIVTQAADAIMNNHNKKRPDFSYSSPLSRPRLPPVLLLVTGGDHGFTAAKSLQVYDARSDCWATLGADVSRIHHGAAFLDGFVYLVGGCNQEDTFKTVQRFNFITSRWQNVASMNIPRCFVSVAVLNGNIFAMGGLCGNNFHNTAERYNPEIGQWMMVRPMHARRSGACATSLNGKVYICGGFNGYFPLSSAECFDPEANQWTMIRPMRSHRWGLRVISYKDKIYAVGGIFNGNCLRTAEAYNPRTNRWTGVPSMHNCRCNFGIEVVDDQLFVVGGNNSFAPISSVERYDEEAGMWYHVSRLKRSRTGLSCCLLHGLQSLAENLFPRGSI